MIKYKEITSNLFSYIKAKMSLIIIVALIAVIGNIVYKDRAPKFVEVLPDTIAESNISEAVVAAEPEAPVLKAVTPEAKKELCASETNYVIEANSLLQTGNFMILDMSTFELFKKQRIDSQRVGYYYRRAGAVKEWYTVFKNEPEEKFVKLETK